MMAAVTLRMGNPVVIESEQDHLSRAENQEWSRGAGARDANRLRPALPALLALLCLQCVRQSWRKGSRLKFAEGRASMRWMTSAKAPATRSSSWAGTLSMVSDASYR